MKAVQHKWDAIEHERDAVEHERKAYHEEMRAKMDAWLGGVKHACLEKKESTPEETEVVAKSQEVPEGATDEETIGAAKDRSRDLCLSVGCRGRLKTRTKRNGWPRQKFAATVGRPIRRTVPAMHKGHVRKGPGKKYRSGIRVPGRTLGSRMAGRSLKKRLTKVNVRGTPEGQTSEKRRLTRPECKNGIRDRGANSTYF
jgi:hypothetical protein